MKSLSVLGFILFIISTTSAFTTILSRQSHLRSSASGIIDCSSSTALSCICIDCKWVTSCKAYHFVETKHEQPHVAKDPDFEPRNGSPTIHVNVRTIRSKEDQEKELARMWNEHASETLKAQAKAASEDDVLVGEATYDFAPVTTYEYDVVKCEDYVEDKGCWVRNMPQEIKEANPDFVPS